MLYVDHLIFGKLDINNLDLGETVFVVPCKSANMTVLRPQVQQHAVCCVPGAEGIDQVLVFD